jgi:hypothetical protein
LTPTRRRLIDAAAGIMGKPDPTDRDRAFMARQRARLLFRTALRAQPTK